MTVDSNTLPLALQPPNIAYTIRPLQKSDLKALRKDCWKHHSLQHSKEHLKSVLKAAKNKRGLGIVVASDIGHLIGYGQIIILPKCIEISDLFVSKAFRCQGIGTAMIQYLIQSMAKHSKTCIEIGVAASNPRALSLYRRLGFKQCYDIMLNLGNGRETVIYLRLFMP